MAVCATCGKDNLPQYKFCLGCGAEIAPSKAAPSASGSHASRMDPTPLPPPRAPTAPPVFDEMGPASDPMTDRDLSNDLMAADTAPSGNGAVTMEPPPAGARPCPSCGA